MTKFAGVIRVVTALGVLLALSLAPAGASTGGKIAGVVKDATTGDGLPQANVAVVGTKLGTTADEKGRFFILNVPAGTYTLKATYIGYADYTVEDVRVSADLTTNLDIDLTSADIQVEEVVIRAERPIIDKNATNAVRIVGAEDLEILPFRGVGQVLALQAGVVEDEGALHIRGSRSDEIGYYVDGASVRNIITGGSAVGLIDEALEEIQLQAGGFNAEYGGANAGIVLQELRTGGRDWDFRVIAESDNFTSDFEERFGTYSYGYSSQVITAGGPVAGNQNIRAFLAGQRWYREYRPTFWSGFEFENLVDTGNRQGRVHWAKDEEGQSHPRRGRAAGGQAGQYPAHRQLYHRLQRHPALQLQPHPVPGHGPALGRATRPQYQPHQKHPQPRTPQRADALVELGQPKGHPLARPEPVLRNERQFLQSGTREF